MTNRHSFIRGEGREPYLDAAALQLRDHVRIRTRIRDEHVQLFHPGDQRDVPAQQLGRIGDRDHLTGDGDHLRIELGLGKMRRHHAALGVQSVGTQEQAVRLQVREGGLRHVSRQRIGLRPQNAAGHDEPHGWDIRQQRGDVQGIGDDVDRLHLQPANLFRDLGGGGARIENDGFAVLNQGRRDLGNAHLLGMVARLLHGDGLVVVLPPQQAPSRAATASTSSPARAPSPMENSKRDAGAQAGGGNCSAMRVPRTGSRVRC